MSKELIYLVGYESGNCLRGFKELENAINCLQENLLNEEGIVLDNEAKEEIRKRADCFRKIAFPYIEYEKETNFYLKTLIIE